MATVDTKTSYTPQDLLEMPDGELYELVDGNLVEHDMGATSSWIGGQVYGIIYAFLDLHKLGWVFPADNSYQCFPDAPNKVRRPDVSFIRLGRLPGEQLPEGHIAIAPDLAVEVVSPNDRAYDIDHKVEEYISAGVRLVWVISPAGRTVRVHRADGTVALLGQKDELDGEDVLPGFSCAVCELFPPAGEQPPGNALGTTDGTNQE